MTRINPFDEISEFKPTPQAKPLERKLIDQLAAETGFVSRQPKAGDTSAHGRRRYTTGRNRQLNLKVTEETAARMYRLAGRRPLGELLELALDALEQQKANQP